MGVAIPVIICWQLRNGTQSRRLAIVYGGEGGGAIGGVRLVASVGGVNAVGVEIVVVEVVGGDGLRLKVGGGGLGLESEDFAEFFGAPHDCVLEIGTVVWIMDLVGEENVSVVVAS